MSTKILLLVLFLYSFNTYAQRTTSPQTAPDTSRQTNQAGDELLTHLSAAESYQISGDLANSTVENRAIIGIALQRLGNISIEEGKYEAAVEVLRESLLYADTAPFRTNLAVAYQRLNNTEQALIEAQNALALDPKFIGAHYLLGNVYFTREDYKAALPELEKAFRSAPDFDIAQALAVSYLFLKQPERAKLLFDEIELSAKKQSPELHLLFAQAFEKTNYPLDAEREIKRALAIDPRHPKANFFFGYLILQQGGSERLAEALTAFEAELKLSPDDLFSNFFAGVAASSINDHAKAIKYLQKAIKIDPKLGGAYLFLGQSQIETNDLTAAEKNLRQAIVLEGGKPEKDYQSRRTHFLLGRLLVKTGRREEGESELKISRELQERSIQSARDEINQILGKVVIDGQNKPVSAAQLAATKIVLTPQRAAELDKSRDYLRNILAQAFHNLGVIAIQSGQADDALDRFASASKWKKDFPGLDRNWGIVSFRAGHFDTAIGPLSRQLASDPKDKLVRKMLALSFNFTKDFANAVLTLKPIEADLAADPELSYFHGIALIQLKRNQEAVPVFNRLAENSQRNAEALLQAAQGFMLLGDYARSVKELQSVVALNGSMAKANYFLGQCLIQLNRYAEAEKAFSRELELDPADVLSKYHLALTLIERKIDPERTITTLEDAIRLKYDYAEARYQLGKIYLERGDTSKAIEQLEIASLSDPTKDYIHYQLSIAYRKVSRKDDADRELKRYQEIKAANRKTDSPMGKDANSPK